MIDLSALNKAMEAEKQAVGTPLDIDIGLIDEDPDQPRLEFDVAALEELSASIGLKGVKSPVSVRPHPSGAGRWILNYGARRLRASVMAGKATIPAFVDESHDSYDQVIENLQRDDLKPMELALFVQKQIKAGNKKKDIAKSLGKSQNFITDLLALIDMPTSIEGLFRTGRLFSPRTVLELRRLHDKHQELVENAISEWVTSGADVGRGEVEALAERLSSSNGSSIETTLPSREVEEGEETNDKEPRISDPGKLKKPLVLVNFKRRRAMLLFNRRPSCDGLAWIRFEDGSGDEEVDAGSIKINLIAESTG